MKTSIVKGRLLMLSLAVCMFILKPVHAQDKPESTKEKKHAVKIKIKTDGGETRVISIDTLLPSGEKMEQVLREIETTLKLKEDALKQLEIELQIDEEALDSLGKKMKKIVILGDEAGDILQDLPESAFEWEVLKEPWDSYSSCMDEYRVKRGEFLSQMPRHPFNPDSWLQQMTPWGKVTKYKIRKKRNGRKIIIKTEHVDGDVSFMFPAPPVPPPPPVPPAPPKKVKKVVIER